LVPYGSSNYAWFNLHPKQSINNDIQGGILLPVLVQNESSPANPTFPGAFPAIFRKAGFTDLLATAARTYQNSHDEFSLSVLEKLTVLSIILSLEISKMEPNTGAGETVQNQSAGRTRMPLTFGFERFQGVRGS
jgi:hypothetical protein